MARTLWVSTASIAAVAATLLLSACTGAAEIPSIESVATSTASASSPSATATPSPTATAAGTPVAMSCDQVLTLQNVYDYNPNFGLDPAFTAPDQIAPLTQIGGVACGWINQTSGTTFAVGIAKPDAATLAAATSQAAATMASTAAFGTAPIQGYFGVQNGVGVAEVFSNGYQIVVTSNDFTQPEEAAELVLMVLANLK